MLGGFFLAGLMFGAPRQAPGRVHAVDAPRQMTPPLDVAAQPDSRAPVDRAGALARAFERWPHLRPDDSSESAYLDWLLETNQDDEDLAAGHLDMVDLMRRAGVASLADPPPDAPQDAVVEGGEAIPDIDDAVAAPLPPAHRRTVAIDPADAAEAFVSWLRVHGHTGSIRADHLSELYGEHCRSEDIPAIAERLLRHEMVALEGVSKGLGEAVTEGGKRHRPTLWYVSSSTSVSHDVPWPDLPAQKRAA